MAIALRATAIGPSVNASSTTITLPTGTVTNDVTIIGVLQANTLVGALTIPAGWTAIVNTPNSSSAIFYRVFQPGDPSSISVTSTVSNWFESCAISYSGCDTTTPIDASNSCWYEVGNAGGSNFTGTVPDNICLAPSVNPNFQNSQLVLIALDPYISGFTMTAPGGFVRQVFTGTGPNVMIADKALTTGANTGDFEVTAHATASGATTAIAAHFGCQIALKASGASAATLAAALPTFASIFANSAGASGTITVPVNNVSNGDLVTVWISTQTGLSATPSGYSLVGGNTGALLYTHTWLTSDPTSVSFTANSNFATFVVAVLHKTGVSTNSVTLDVSGNATGAGSVSVSSLISSTTVDLAVFFSGTRTATSGTITGLSPSMNYDLEATEGPLTPWGWTADVSSAIGAFTATLTPGSGSNTNDGIAALFMVSGTVTATLAWLK